MFSRMETMRQKNVPASVTMPEKVQFLTDGKPFAPEHFCSMPELPEMRKGVLWKCPDCGKRWQTSDKVDGLIYNRLMWKRRILPW